MPCLGRHLFDQTWLELARAQRGWGGICDARTTHSARSSDLDARELAHGGHRVVAFADLRRAPDMSVLYIVLPLALLVVAVAVVAFVWATRHGQFDDLDT